MHFLALAVNTALGLDDRLVEQVRQIVGVNVSAQNNIPSTPAIAAVGAAFRDKFFASKTDAAATAVTSVRHDPDPVDEHDLL